MLLKSKKTFYFKILDKQKKKTKKHTMKHYFKQANAPPSKKKY